MSAADQKLTKVYSDRSYKYTTMVRHQGLVIAFAMDTARRIYYSVLNLSDAQEGDGKTDADYWAQDPKELCFPREVTEVGYAAGGSMALPTVQLGGRVEGSETELLPEEIDPFLSSTARLTADCPFSAYSDGAHIFLFRQAVAGDHADAVFLLKSGTTSADPARKDYQLDAAGAKVPIANASLLCDRFVLAGDQLRSTIEVRFRRSRHKTIPHSAKDSLGPQDMNGNYFFEPTQHLSLVRNLAGGRFCVLQAPTQMPDVKYWQIFAHNSRTRRIDSFSIERAADGLFNTQGTQCYTSPDPQYQSAVYEREPGQCPFTQKELIPIVSEDGFADAGLLLDGANSHVTISDSPLVAFGGKPYSLEAWIRPDEIGPQSRCLVTKANKSLTGGFALCLDAQGRLAAQNARGELVSSTSALTAGQWAHVAVSFDGAALQFFVNGEAGGLIASPAAAETTTPVWIGASQNGNAPGARFKGMIDEVRIWNRARSAEEIRRDRNGSLVGNETGLAAYYRCDEGAGTALYDQTDNALHGTLQGAAWATSDARVGNHPGVRRDSFNFAGRTLESPLSAILYYQQERPNADQPPLKRQARVLLTCATGGPDAEGKPTENRHVAVLDFAVARDGSLAQVPDEVKLDFINTVTQTATLDEISAMEQQISKLKAEIAQEVTMDAISFNGGEEQINCGSKLQLNNSDFTIEFWTRRQQVNRHDYVVYMGMVHIWLYAGSSLWFHTSPGSALSAPGSTADTEWHHWACTYQQATRQRIIYRDGVQVAADVAPAPATPGEELILGRTPWGTADLLLDEVRIWKRVRTPEDIQANLYHRATGKEPGLEAYFTFPNGQLKDLTGHGHDGRVSGGKPNPARSILRSALSDAKSEQKQAKIDALQTELANKTGGLRGGDVAVPMPLVATDRAGLSIVGGVLGFAYSANRPVLLESATGNVVLYFRGQNGNFYSAYYDTLVSRYFKYLTAGNGVVSLIARSAGLDLAQTSVTVTDGATPATCNIVIASPQITETWPEVPRHPQRFADVLNGFGDEVFFAGKVTAVEEHTLVLATGLSRSLSRDTRVEVGEWSGRLAEPVAEGETRLPMKQAPPASLNGSPAPVGIVPYDYGLASCTRAGSNLADGSLLFAASAKEANGPVQNGTASDGAAASTTHFWADAPGRAFSFDGRKQHLRLPAEKLSQAEVAGPATLEAWVNASTVAQPVRLLHANTAASRYTLGLQGTLAKDALSFNGGEEQINCGSKLQLDNSDLTIEFWAKRRRTDRNDFVINHGWVLIHFHTSHSLWFYTSGNSFLYTPGLAGDTDWHHWACTYQHETRQRIIYRDGVQVAADVTPAPATPGKELIFGMTQWGTADMLLDEARIWKRVRTAEEIKAEMYRRIKPNAPGLEAYYTFPNRELKDLSGHGHDGKVTGGNPVVATSPIGTDAHQVFAGVGPNFVRTRETFPNGVWNHLAASFNQSWALQFNGANAWLNAGTDQGLNLTDELTVEVFLQVDALGREYGVLGKGRMADGTSQSVPYQLAIAKDGKLGLGFETRGGKPVWFSSTEALAAGAFYRVAVVRKNYQMMEGAKFTTWQEIVFYFNGREVGRHRYDGESPAGHNGAFEIGRTVAGRHACHFAGLISEVRLWNKARDPKEVGASLAGKEKGLVARWTFDENRGNVARDAAGGFDARLYGARWTKDPDPRGSAMRLYVNGAAVATDPLEATDAVVAGGSTEPQFTLGGMVKGEALQDAFVGTMEEVRVWRTRRTEAEILDNLFARLRGEKQDLLAYYTFDFDSTDPSSTQVVDNGLRGNHLPLPADATRPNIVLPTAPVSNDTAQVRSALAGVKTAFHDNIDAEPAVCEYGMMQTDSHGNTAGAMKRCYSFIKNGVWNIISGYKVGSLITEWVGQAQFDPQVIGFVEGAPPVPSENLVDGPCSPDDGQLSGVTSVKFTQADQVVSSVSSSRQSSTKFGLEASLAASVDFNTQAVLAPFGFGTTIPAIDVKLKAGLKTAIELENSWSSENKVSQGTNTSQSLSAALVGFWEDSRQIRNPAMGQRFVPGNTGFALVQSATADVYAIRLAHNGALVGYRMQPNPDIPRDWNIVPFPINPFYVKQGTLDGCLGFDADGRKVLDADYAAASGYGEYSYFKPREAYALKRRIVREQQRIQDAYDNANVSQPGRMGNAFGAAVTSALGINAPVPPEVPRPPVPDTHGRRSFANTYVWTADGGFFAESTETVDSFTVTSSGSYSLTGSTTASFGIEATIGPVGLEAQLDATVGGSINETMSKDREASRTFSLEVECNLPSDMQMYGEDGKPCFDDKNLPIKATGRVDAYRWMTFFLASDSTNFDDLFNKVVDPAWLAEGTHPNAVAMRQARQSAKRPPCWRVLHRVTYVSRLLPPAPPADAPPVVKAMQVENISSNWELIKRLEPYVKSSTGSLRELAEATREALMLELPALAPHAEQITGYLALYYGIQTQ